MSGTRLLTLEREQPQKPDGSWAYLKDPLQQINPRGGVEGEGVDYQLLVLQIQLGQLAEELQTVGEKVVGVVDIYLPSKRSR